MLTYGRHIVRLRYLWFGLLVFTLMVTYELIKRDKSVRRADDLDRVTRLEVSVQKIRENVLWTMDKLQAMDKSDIQGSSYPVINGILNPEKFRYNIDTPHGLCKNNKFAMFVYVHSAVVNFERRKVLRETWGKRDALQKLNVGLVFITGIVANNTKAMEKLNDEIQKYRDIVQNDYVDTYGNITLKSTSAINWVALNCAPYVPIILKTDDDMFVNISRLLTYVNNNLTMLTHTYGGSFMLCNVWENKEVDRDEGSRWYVSWETYGEKRYPSFCPGAAWVMTGKAVVNLRETLFRARLFPMDDVFVTAFLAPKAGVKLVPFNDRYLDEHKDRPITEQLLQSGFIFAHVTLANMVKLWHYTAGIHRDQVILARADNTAGIP